MSNQTTLEKVREIIAEQVALDLEQVTEQSGLVADLDVDSLDLVEICMSVEEEFNIEIADDESEKLTTVESIVHLINRKLAARIKE